MTPSIVRSVSTALFCAAFIPVAAARGQWTADPSVNTPICTASGDQVQPKIRNAAGGASYVSWFDNRTGGYDVYLQRLDAAGVPQWTANGIEIADRSVSSTEDYGLAVDGDDNAVLVYGLVNFTSLAVQKIDPAGNKLWGPSGVVFTTADSHSPRVTVTTDGYTIVGWSEGAGLILHKLDASGALQWGPGGISITEASRRLLLADLQPGDNGSVIALWVRCGGTNCITSNKHLYAQKYDAAGTPLWNGGSPRIIFDGTSSLQNATFPPFLPDGAGGAVFGWYENGGSRNAYVQHVDAAGNELFPHNGVASTGVTAGRIRISASVAYDAAANEIFLSSVESSSPTQNMWGVRAQRFDAAGARQWTDDGAVLSAMDSSQEGFDRTVAFGGGCITHWFEDTGGGTAVVKSARLDPSGAHEWSGSPLIASTRPSGKSRLDVAMDNCGMSRLVWSDGTSGGGQDVYVQNVRANGTLGPAVPTPPGDMNCDGSVTPADVDPFVDALLDPVGYAAANTCCPISNADMNSDTFIDGLDAAGFVDALVP